MFKVVNSLCGYTAYKESWLKVYEAASINCKKINKQKENTKYALNKNKNIKTLYPKASLYRQARK